MRNAFSHTRDIYCLFSRHQLIYRIPIYFSPELDYLRTPFLQLEFDLREQQRLILYKKDELKTYIDVRNLNGGCCDKK